jgi:hypothetical protein
MFHVHGGVGRRSGKRSGVHVGGRQLHEKYLKFPQDSAKAVQRSARRGALLSAARQPPDLPQDPSQSTHTHRGASRPPTRACHHRTSSSTHWLPPSARPPPSAAQRGMRHSRRKRWGRRGAGDFC